MGKTIGAWLFDLPSQEIETVRFGFGLPMPTALGLLLGIAIAIGVGGYAWRKTARLPRSYRMATATLRGGAAAILFLLLLDPILSGERVVAGNRFVAVLFDNSKSMQIEVAAGETRGEALQAEYRGALDEFEGELDRRYQLVRYAVGDRARRVGSVDALDFRDAATRLGDGASQVLAELGRDHVSALVLFSDGNENPVADASARERLEEIYAAGVPIYTVGTDRQENWSDLEIADLSLRRAQFDKSPMVVTASVRAEGLAGREAEISIERRDGGAAGGASRTVATQRVPIRGDQDEQEVRLEFVPRDRGWLHYRIAARLTSGEKTARDRIEQNNHRDFLIDNRMDRRKILYFAGRPNWENKFTRRALAEDDELELTSLIRISQAEKKFVFRGRKTSLSNPLFEGFEGLGQDQPRYDESVFLRFGPGAEALKGYPNDAGELFDFDLVIWGDIEHEFFSPAQLRLTREFVRKRGGALLLLGGPHSFVEGNYAGSVIEAMMPVSLSTLPKPHARESEIESGAEGSAPRRFATKPTMEGTLSGAWSLDHDGSANRKMWEDMPPLSDLNDFGLLRPGATVVARAESLNEEGARGASQPLFVQQRYGEGKCAVRATGATWQWQMELEEDDARHERLWRQIVRDLTKDIPEPVYLREKESVYAAERPANFEFVVRDAMFDEREGLRVAVAVRDPSGAEIAAPVEESIEETGVYAVEYRPASPGAHHVSLKAKDEAGAEVGRLEEAFLAEPDLSEFQDARLNGKFLQEVAERSGGGYFSLSSFAEIARVIPKIDPTQTVTTVLHLWHLAPFYYLVVGMMALEWFLRRRKGYA